MIFQECYLIKVYCLENIQELHNNFLFLIKIDYLQSRNRELQDSLETNLRKSHATSEDNIVLGTKNANLSRDLQVELILPFVP